jgi:hypothetical protein
VTVFTRESGLFNLLARLRMRLNSLLTYAY